MRLSDAINLGSSLLKPIGAHIEGCAMGMALVAVGDKIIPKESDEQIRKNWKWATEEFVHSPCECVTQKQLRPVACVVMHLFDAHVMQGSGYDPSVIREPWKPWNLEQLVDWVRSVEPEEAPSVDGALARSEASTEVVEK